MRESCLVHCYSGIQSLFEVVLLYTFYTVVAFLSSVVCYFGDLPKLANMAFVRQKTFISQ